VVELHEAADPTLDSIDESGELLHERASRSLGDDVGPEKPLFRATSTDAIPPRAHSLST
jgi:hypothetical protein